MSRPHQGPPGARHRLLGLLTALGCVLSLAAVAAPASGTPPQNVRVPEGVVAVLSTSQPGLGGAVPSVLAQAGVTPITLTLTLTPEDAVFTEDATFALDVTLAHGGPPHGTFEPGEVIMPEGHNSYDFTVIYSAVDNGVVLTPRLVAPSVEPFDATAAEPFQSLKRVTTVQAGPGVTDVGGDVCGRDGSDIACLTVSVPQGTTSTLATTTVGACTPDLGCPAGSEVVGFIADLGTTYTRESPAQIIIRCDRSRCGRGGIKSYVVHMSFAAEGPLDIVSRPCVAKGVADDGHGNDFCTDYVSSHRDKGDLLLVVNVLQDYRGAV